MLSTKIIYSALAACVVVSMPVAAEAGAGKVANFPKNFSIGVLTSKKPVRGRGSKLAIGPAQGTIIFAPTIRFRLTPITNFSCIPKSCRLCRQTASNLSVCDFHLLMTRKNLTVLK